jgi:3-oxoacyl-[acyl-carrier-protein] synthase III
MKLKNVGIKGIGSYVPIQEIPNKNIEDLNVGTTAEWIAKNLGIHNRRNVADELPSDLAHQAALNAIADAGLDKEDIDLIIVATSSPDRIAPSTACITAGKLDLKRPAFDINAVCGGFVYGMQLATNLVSTGQYSNILLIGADAYSKNTDWSTRNCVFFGDGAGAVIISKIKDAWVDTEIYGDGTGTETAPGDSFTCYHGENFNMNASAVYEFATKVLPDSIKRMMDNHSLTNEDIDLMIPHQPGHRVLFKTSEILDFPLEKVIFNMTDFANTAGASIPMALDRAYRENKIKSGDVLIMPAVGSGWVWGVTLLKYIK